MRSHISSWLRTKRRNGRKALASRAGAKNRTITPIAVKNSGRLVMFPVNNAAKKKMVPAINPANAS